MTVFRSAVVRFQGLVFASIAKTSNEMVGHKASRSKRGQNLAKALLRIVTFIHEAHVPSDRPNLSASPGCPFVAVQRQRSVKSQVTARVRVASEQEKRAQGTDARLKPTRHR